MGELLRETERAKAGRPAKLVTARDQLSEPTLAELGITKNESQGATHGRWEQEQAPSSGTPFPSATEAARATGTGSPSILASFTRGTARARRLP